LLRYWLIYRKKKEGRHEFKIPGVNESGVREEPGTGTCKGQNVESARRRKARNTGYIMDGEHLRLRIPQQATGVTRDRRGRVEVIDERCGGNQRERKSLGRAG
jgi:hypothetical protein